MKKELLLVYVIEEAVSKFVGYIVEAMLYDWGQGLNSRPKVPLMRLKLSRFFKK